MCNISLQRVSTGVGTIDKGHFEWEKTLLNLLNNSFNSALSLNFFVLMKVICYLILKTDSFLGMELNLFLKA